MKYRIVFKIGGNFLNVELLGHNIIFMYEENNIKLTPIPIRVAFTSTDIFRHKYLNEPHNNKQYYVWSEQQKIKDPVN